MMNKFAPTALKISAPCKVHLLGEHAVVYGKPAILTTVNLRLTITLEPLPSSIARDDLIDPDLEKLKQVIEPIVKIYSKINKIPPYKIKVESQIPIGSGLGSSAAISACYIAVLLNFLKVKCDINTLNGLVYEAEKVFHGNPSGADNATIVFGESIWYRKESADLKLIHLLPFSIPSKLADNFILINTGKPQETTKDMVLLVKDLYEKKPKIVNAFLENQERLVRNLLDVLKNEDEKEFIRIIREGEKNLESIGVCSPQVKKLIREIEKAGGAAKICGAGGKTKATGIVLAYHKDKKMIEKIAKENGLNYFTAALGVEGLRQG